MKFSCDKSILNSAISTVQKAVSAKSPIPALEGIMVAVYDNGILQLTAYDLNISIHYDIDVGPVEHGTVIFPSQKFGDMIRSLPSGTITVETDNNTLKTSISQGNFNFQLMGISPEDYPELPEVEGADGFEVTYSDFKNLVRQTIFAVAITDLKPILTGVLFEHNKEENMINAVAVDSFRLAMKKAPYADLSGDFSKVVIPARPLNELLKILPDSDEDTIKIRHSNRFVSFEFGTVKMVSRLLEGEFLDYKAAIPKDYKFRVKVNVHDFEDRIRAASVVANSTSLSPIRCNFDFDRILISTANVNEKCDSELLCEPFSEKMVIWFNYKYMLAALNATDDSEIMI